MADDLDVGAGGGFVAGAPDSQGTPTPDRRLKPYEIRASVLSARGVWLSATADDPALPLTDEQRATLHDVAAVLRRVVGQIYRRQAI